MMDGISAGASASMMKGAQAIQEDSAMKLINSGAAVANATMQSGDNGQMQAQVMQEQGVGQKVDITV